MKSVKKVKSKAKAKATQIVRKPNLAITDLMLDGKVSDCIKIGNRVESGQLK